MWVDTYGRGGLGWGYIFIQGYLVKFGHKVTVIASLVMLEHHYRLSNISVFGVGADHFFFG